MRERVPEFDGQPLCRGTYVDPAMLGIAHGNLSRMRRLNRVSCFFAFLAVGLTPAARPSITPEQFDRVNVARVRSYAPPAWCDSGRRAGVRQVQTEGALPPQSLVRVAFKI
jgi:hypothetical protein